MEFEGGDVVGIVEGEVTSQTDGVPRVLVVSHAPNVIGNAPDSDAEDDYEKVAFTGQVSVKVRGPVADGQLVVPSGEEDGTAVAVDPSEREPGTPVIGQAWEESTDQGVSEVTATVGIDDPATAVDSLHTETEQLRERVDDLEDEKNALRAENERLREQNAELESRLDRIEAELGIDATASQQGVADD